MPIEQKLCEVALGFADGANFEKFAQTFHSAVVGSEFVPLGGIHDGGADGFEERIFNSKSRVTVFLQASITESFSAKIQQTIERLRTFGREPKQVIFYFSKNVPNHDQIAEKISEKNDLVITIRDQKYISTNINNYPSAISSFSSFIEPSINFLRVKPLSPLQNLPAEIDRTICAYLSHEVDRRRGQTSLLNSVTDSLVLWSLEGTDPDKQIFRTREEISSAIMKAVPTAKKFLKGVLESRLQELSSKAASRGRLISFHKSANGYCLTFEQRNAISDENIEELATFNYVKDKFTSHMMGFDVSLEPLIADIVKIFHSSLEAIFYQQGLAISLFAVDGDDDVLGDIQVSEIIETEIRKLRIGGDAKAKITVEIRNFLRKLVYDPDATERSYLQKLSRTYFLLFILQNDPKIIEYFNTMKSNMVLYVGSDIIIRALAETLLDQSMQKIQTTLDIIVSAGGELIITEPAIDEVFHHLHGTCLEFENHYAEVEPIIPEEIIPEINRILIRCYLYARTSKTQKKIKGWRSFIGQFVSYEDIRGGRNIESLKNYLCSRYKLQYESRDDMDNTIDQDSMNLLSNSIVKERSNKKDKDGILARNDAAHALRVLEKRKEIRDGNNGNPFGYKTWWLTYEKVIQKCFISTFGPAKPKFIIRPEFILNYLTYSPEKSEIVESYRSIFPSVLGVTLGRRLEPHALNAVLDSARSVFLTDPHRAKARIIEYVNTLKADQVKRYDQVL
jgi:hypothetical protein